MSGSGAKQSQEETILTLLASNHSLQWEIAALREAVRLAHDLIFRPAYDVNGQSTTEGDDVEEWEESPAVRRALEEER